MRYTKVSTNSNGRCIRSGKAAIFLLLGMTVILMLVVFPINSQLMLEARTAQLNASDAAALASIHVLVDDRALTNNSRVIAQLVADAKAEAVRIARLNFVAGKPLVLEINRQNEPENDIALGVLAKPESKNLSIGSLTDSSFVSAINTVRITARKTRKRKNEIQLIGGRLFCLSSIDLITKSTATMDCFVIGFRNHDNIAIPMMPIAIKRDGDGHSWESKIEGGEGPDQFAYDPNKREFTIGSDGLREMKVCLVARTANLLNGRYLTIGTENATGLAAQITGGITKTHLRRFGRDLVFAKDLDQLDLPIAAISNQSGSSPQGLLRDALNELQSTAEARVWPLYSTIDNQGRTLVISRFVAARIIAVQVDGERLCIWLQPAKMATSTAVTNSSRQSFSSGNSNPYICRLRLVE